MSAIEVIKPFVSAIDNRLFYDVFTDPANTDPARRHAKYRYIPGQGVSTPQWVAWNGAWVTNGTGGLYCATGGNTDFPLGGAVLMGPPVTSGDRRIRLKLNSTFSNGRGGVVFSDGRNAQVAQVYGVGGNTLRIAEVDNHAFSPTYSIAAGNVLNNLAVSAPITDSTPSADKDFIIDVVGTVITMTHVQSGVSVSATATKPIGPYIGLTNSVNAASVIKAISVEPLAPQSFYDMGNSVQLIDSRPLCYLGQADGIDMADLNGDGRQDFAIINAFNNNLTAAGLYTLLQGANEAYSLNPINVNSSASVTDKWTKGQGCVIATMTGSNRYVFANDQSTNQQWLIDLNTGDRLQLSTYAIGQDPRLLTINSETCIVNTFEGVSGTGAITNGGVVGYRYIGGVGGNPMLLASWQVFTITKLPGAWAFQKTGFQLVNLNGDGQLWLVVGARYSARNSSAVPGLYAVPLPASPFAVEWTGQVQLYAAGAGNDFVGWDFGDFSGDGNGFDAAGTFLTSTGAVPIQGAPFYLRKSTGWTKTSTVTLGVAAANQCWNVCRMPVRGSGGRDGFLAVIGTQGFYHVYYSGGWQSKIYQGAVAAHISERPNFAVLDRGGNRHSLFQANTDADNVLEQQFGSAI